MDWTDAAIVLHVRPHGETNAVLEVFTREHGRHPGLVRGGRSRKIRPALQTGNLLTVEWRARLQEHLGFFTLELAEPYAARALDVPALDSSPRQNPPRTSGNAGASKPPSVELLDARGKHGTGTRPGLAYCTNA